MSSGKRSDPVERTGNASDWSARIAYQRERNPHGSHASNTQRRAYAEQRLSLRKAVPLSVVLNYGMSYSAPAAIRDMSLGGACLDMSPVDLGEGTAAELIVRFRYKGVLKEHRLPATVIRVEDEGVALHFGKYDDDAYTDLINLMNAF